MDDKERYQRGTKARRKVLGNAWVDRSDANRNAFNADWQDFITRCAWGEVWTRPHFDERTRRILVIGTMMAIGRWEEFRLHVRAALVEGGFSADDIKEIILQQAVYCGVPVGNHAIREAGEVLAEVGKGRWLAARARRSSVEAVGYGPPSGYEPLRVALKQYLARARGLSCDADQIMIVNGSQQAFDLIARVLLDPGDAVVMEEPNYPGARLPFQAVGARLIGIEVDSEGLDTARLPPASARARAGVRRAVPPVSDRSHHAARPPCGPAAMGVAHRSLGGRGRLRQRVPL